ncbi:aminotransferase class I/II-fold pyridoxal phosphate-dependent enzyme [Xylophilus ampelinus]|uniref:histidinol-phosphate transaminase n=1 Tax=Xylophilus ampelinus TaxID=54067 RepID=A0A318SJE7_9BURK|nr:aminotransferase class I/II-fold pyridoxal phosphate-dependent enzyme [Xylophilus ampelinus]MCS4509905.1 aminotransferase class I/II-fold pyridoxal phosphate-dependent enzyme [Xylophilus ampelinus]PYE78545.1 histidinol-phosphate aminotransferase [Xylophilus ampelinus]
MTALPLDAIAAARVHGGPDGGGPVRFDFSTNANACGPSLAALVAVQAADATRYPDPRYTALRERLAAFHGVAPGRLLLAASASEAIFRITAWAAQRGIRQACIPTLAYGDYATAAAAWRMAVYRADTASASAPMPRAGAVPVLVWACDPSSPRGTSDPVPAAGPDDLLVLDRAYAPLRLSGRSAWAPADLDRAWQLWSPNKALGLTGLRAAYAIAPTGAEASIAGLYGLSPSWPVGAHGVALLQAWCEDTTQLWLAESLETLRAWNARQQAICDGLGWTVLPSDTPFFCARLPLSSARAAALRRAGIQLRDGTSFGLPGHARLSVQSPAAQDALRAAWQAG